MRTEREAADAHEIEWAVRLFGPQTFAPDSDFSETVCIMALPAEDDPVHGIGPEDKHATLLYFGDRSKSADPERIEQSKGLFLDVLRVAAKEIEPFEATVTGIEPLGDEDPPAQVWLLDSPDLQRLFSEIPEIDSEIHSMYEDADATRYPEYKPHVTIGYGPAQDDATEASEDGYVGGEDLSIAEGVDSITFDRLSLWWGNEHIDIPLGDPTEFDALLTHFGFDPTQPRASDGKWNPGGGQGNKKDDKKKKPVKKAAKKPPPMSKQKRKRLLVKAILKALDSVLDTLSNKQAQALIEQIMNNADAFIDGQAAGPHKGGGKKGGSPAKKSSPATKSGPDKPGSGGKSGGGSGGGSQSGEAGIIAGVKGLLKRFGSSMKEGDRKSLERAVGALEKS